MACLVPWLMELDFSLLQAEVLLNATTSRVLWTSISFSSGRIDWTDAEMPISLDYPSMAEFVFRGFPTYGDAISLKGIHLATQSDGPTAQLRLASATGGMIRVGVDYTDWSEPLAYYKTYVRESGSGTALKPAYAGKSR